MHRYCKWRFLLISPLVLILSSYLFLIGANYYYAGRAEYVLQRIRALPINQSSVAELKRLGSERGLRYQEPQSCENSCIHLVSPNNEWMRALLRSPTLAMIGEKAGLRAWMAVGDILTENQEVTGKIYGLGFFDGRMDPEIQVWTTAEKKSAPNMNERFKRHPGYGFSGASNVRSFRVLVSNGASAENLGHAFQYNLKCLTGWHKCDEFSQIVPAAWADYKDDNK
jgi:hypothetical protein